MIAEQKAVADEMPLMKGKTLVFRGMLLLALAAMILCGCASDEQKKMKYLGQADESIQKGDYQAAEIYLKNVIQLDPASVEGHLKLGEAYLKSDNPQGAFGEFASVVKLDPNNTQALLKMAAFYMLARKFEESQQSIETVLKSEPNNIEAHFLSAGLNEMQGNLDKAGEMYSRIIELDGKQARAYIGMATVLSRQRKFDEAERYLQKASNLDPNNSMTWLALIGFYMSQKDYARAEKQIELAIGALPGSSELRITQGNFYTQQKKHDLAENAFMKAIELDAANVAPYLSAARFYDVVGKQDQAKSMYRQALALRQDDSDLKTTVARYFLRVNETAEAEALIEEVLKKRSGYLPAMLLKGELLVGKRNWNDAIAVLDQVIAQDDKAGQAYYFKGVAHLAKGEFQVAKSSFNRAVELNPNDNRTKLVLAELKLKERDFTGAEKDLKAVLGALPDNYQALLLLGKAFLGQGKLDEAQKSFNRLIELQAQNPEGYYQRGIVWRLQKNGGAAMADFESALALNPKLLDAFGQIVGILASRKDFTAALARCDQQLHVLKDSSFHQAFIMSVKGRLYMAQDMAKEAESAYQAAILADPNFTQPYYGLAQLYLRRKEVELAIEQYDAMLVKNPNMVGPNMLLGALYDAQKKFDSSEKHYREALRIDAGFAPAANNLAFLLTERGEDLGEALQLAQKAKGKLPEDPSVMDTLGWVYYKRGLYDLAIAEFAGSLEKLPNNASVHYHIGLAYSKKGDTGLAKEHLTKALQLDAAFDGAENARKVLAEM